MERRIRLNKSVARILIIDDERDVVDLIRFVLERDGHEILEAGNGQEGLESAQKNLPDLIVLDIMMPEMDGYTMNQHLLADAQARKIPVLVVTARGGLQSISAESPNIRHHIEKPFDPSDFRARVQAILHPS
jgi:two-component system, OmpR family, alkaline phosphatase synthesis response regulator PhoP